MIKPEVGQTIFSLNVGNDAINREQKLSKVIVTRVGRKFFYVQEESWSNERINGYLLSDWSENTNFSANSKLYADAKEWEDEKEASDIVRKFKDAFQYGSNNLGLSIDKLRAISAILDS